MLIQLKERRSTVGLQSPKLNMRVRFSPLLQRKKLQSNFNVAGTLKFALQIYCVSASARSAR